MRLLLVPPIVYLAAVADTSLAGMLRVGNVSPDFLAVAAMLWLLVIAKPGKFLAAGVFGLTQDLVSPGRLGPGVAGFLLVGYLVARVRARLAPGHFLSHAAITWAGVTLLALGMASAHWLLGDAPGAWLTLSERAAGVGLYTAAIAVPLFMIAGWILNPEP